MSIVRNRVGGALKLFKEKYIRKVKKKLNMTDV